MINENQIWAFLIAKFQEVLNENGYNDWVILRNYQPSIQGLRDKAIYLHKVTKRRIGTQGNTTIYDNGECKTVDHWYEEILIQVGAYKKLNPETDTEDTITSEDVLSILLAYINSARKVEDWKSAGYEVIKAIEARETYETEDWLIIVTSDHGGIETGHGGPSIQERMTFVVMNKEWD